MSMYIARGTQSWYRTGPKSSKTRTTLSWFKVPEELVTTFIQPKVFQEPKKLVSGFQALKNWDEDSLATEDVEKISRKRTIAFLREEGPAPVFTRPGVDTTVREESESRRESEVREESEGRTDSEGREERETRDTPGTVQVSDMKRDENRHVLASRNNHKLPPKKRLRRTIRPKVYE